VKYITYKGNMEVLSRNHSCSGKAVILQIPPKISSMQCASTVFYRHLWPVCLYRIFPHYFTKGRTFEKETLL